MLATRDVAAYRRKMQDKSRAEFQKQRTEAIRAAARLRAIKRAEQTRKCYQEYSPPQIRFAHSMIKCLAKGPVSPVYVGRR